MKVVIHFEPLKLISSCEQIKREYKNKYDYENPPSGHLEELIDEISKLNLKSIEDYAMMLKDYDINYLAYHLPKEENIIINSKILKIIMYKLSEDVFKVYFSSWQKYYNFLSNNLGTKNLFLLSDNAADKTSYLPEKTYNLELRSRILIDPVDDVLSEYISKIAESTNSELSEVISVFFLISPSSVLGINILKKIYLFCSEKHLLKTSDLELCNIANAYSLEEKIIFFINFVTKVNPKHFKEYLKLADIAKTFFNKSVYKLENLETPVRIKFQMWFSLIDINDIFGDSERGIFWKARAIEYNAVKVNKIYSDMVIMHFEKFVATEFIEGGAIYIVSKNEYNTTTKMLIHRSTSEQDLKTKLFHRYQDTENRYEHRGNWRGNVCSMIRYLN